METTPEKVAAILKTLPIGFYLGSRAEVVLDTSSPTSFVNMLAKEIHVAYANVRDNLAGLPNNTAPVEVVRATRCSLYHETGHLMVTPKDMEVPWISRLSRDESRSAVNIIEDERLETLLRNRFHGVNFRENVFRISGWAPGWKPQDFVQFLFGVCRLRVGPQNLRDELDKLIAAHPTAHENAIKLAEDYRVFAELCLAEWQQQQTQLAATPPPPPPSNGKSADRNTGDGQAGENPPPPENGGQGADPDSGETKDEGSDANDSSSPSSSREEPKDSSGEEEVKEEEEDGSESEQTNSESGSESGKSGEGDGDKEGEGEGEAKPESDGADSQSGGNGCGSEEKGEPEEGGDGEDDADPAANAAEQAEQSVTAPELSDKEWKKAQTEIAKALKTYTDSGISSRMTSIIIRATNRRAARAGVSHGYAGRIDPRAVATRGDYRWLVKDGDEGTGKDRLHLRLWVDDSGSFKGNIDQINKLIATLLDFERSNPAKFALDVVLQGPYVRLHDKKQPIVAGGGTYFNEAGAEQAIRATAKPGWRELNVMVWDGRSDFAPTMIPPAIQAALKEAEQALDDVASMPFDTDEERDARYRAYIAAEAAYRKAHINCRALALRPVNSRDTVIVSDTNNKEILDAGAPLARRKFISGDYAKEFINEVLRLLDAVI